MPQIDKEYLDRQVEEKKRLRDLEREHECRQDEALLRSSKLAILLERQQDEVNIHDFLFFFTQPINNAPRFVGTTKAQ